MRKIGEIKPADGHNLIVYFNSKDSVNPYYVYHEWNDIGEHGIIRRKRIGNRYADFLSCMMDFQSYVLAHNAVHHA